MALWLGELTGLVASSELDIAATLPPYDMRAAFEQLKKVTPMARSSFPKTKVSLEFNIYPKDYTGSVLLKNAVGFLYQGIILNFEM